MQTVCIARKSGELCHFYNFLQRSVKVIPASGTQLYFQHQSRMHQTKFLVIPSTFCHEDAVQIQAHATVPCISHFCTMRHFSSGSRSQEGSSPQDGKCTELPEFKPFYRLPSIVALRILSRVKIAQTCLTLAILPPLYHYHAANLVTTTQLQFSVGVATFALFMLYAMSFYLRRVIGAMYLHREGHLIKVSHLTFWGSRQDSLVPTADVIPLSEGTNKPGEVLLKFERYSTDHVLYYTLRFGLLVNLETFEEVFGKPRGVESQGGSSSRSSTSSGKVGAK